MTDVVTAITHRLVHADEGSVNATTDTQHIIVPTQVDDHPSVEAAEVDPLKRMFEQAMADIAALHEDCLAWLARLDRR